MPQRNGTAVHSLAVGQLQELEGLVGSEREKQEEVISVAMGSTYHGEALCSRFRVHGAYKTFFQPVQTWCVFLDNREYFLLTLTFETTSAMQPLFLALVLFPRVQR